MTLHHSESFSVNWTKRWLDLAKLVSGWSKDRSRKVGAVIVGERQVVLSLGWNGFPRGIDDDVFERHMRPAKYAWTEHAERNAIFNAAAEGVSLRDSTIYINGDITFPCVDCARSIIQAGITRVVIREEELTDDDVHKFDTAREMLEEAGVHIAELTTQF